MTYTVTNGQEDIVRRLRENPDKRSYEIARLMQRPKPSVRRDLVKLTRAGRITRERTSSGCYLYRSA